VRLKAYLVREVEVLFRHALSDLQPAATASVERLR
jgi:hypothetical protein